jgi:hypothetical protein
MTTNYSSLRKVFGNHNCCFRAKCTRSQNYNTARCRNNSRKDF